MTGQMYQKLRGSSLGKLIEGNANPDRALVVKIL